MSTELIIHDRILWVRKGSYERSAARAEIIAEVERLHEEHGTLKRSLFQTQNAAIDLTAQVAGLRQEIEQACADSCGMCRDFPEAVATKFDDNNWRHWADTSNWKHCGASTIRERAYQREQSK